MKSLSAVYCLALWTYFTVFAFMAEAPKDPWRQTRRNQYGNFMSFTPHEFRLSLPSLENNLETAASLGTYEDIPSLETDEFSENDSAPTELRNGSANTPQDPLTPLDVSVDLTLVSKNSCLRINDSVYTTEEKKITFFEYYQERDSFNWDNMLNLQNSSFKRAVLDADDLAEIITRTNRSKTLENSKSMTVHFFMNTSKTEMRHDPDHYAIFRCNFFVKNSSAITKMKSGGSLRKEKQNNISLTVRFQGCYDSGEFNFRTIVKDMDKLVEPAYCSSKIPFFYSLVISGDLKRSFSYPIFVTFNYILSTCSLVLIFITAKLSHEWRQKRSNIILTNFALSIFSQIMLHFISEFSEIDEGLCTIITVLCHYFTLVQFLWTSTIAYMQYRRYVQVFEEKTSYFLLKLVLFTWLTPILVISACLFLVFSNLENSKKTCADKFKTCSLINTNLLKYGVALPIFFTLLVNFVFYILIFRHLLRRKFEFDQRSSALVEVRLAFVLFFLLDLNLMVAIIADLLDVDILALIFVTSQSLQGVLLFVVFVIRNKCSRKMYVRWMKIMFDRIVFYVF